MNVSNNSRLFPNAARSTQLEADQRRSRELLQQMQRDTRNPTPNTMRDLENRARELSRIASGSHAAAFTETYKRALRGILRHATAQTQQSAGLVSRLLGSLGLPGRTIAEWLRSREGRQSLRPIEEQIEAALRRVEDLHPEQLPTSPEAAGGRRIPDRPEVSTPQPPPNRLPPAPPAQSPDDNSPHPNVRILPNGDWRIRGPGYLRTLRADHPALTGRMVPVTSSNVHSIGYEFNFDRPTRGNLIVRYYQRNRHGSGRVAGPTYQYLRVHPDFFDDLWIQATSKGKWIWDNMRIRGTVAGHQYSYNLARAAQNYLPRRARVVSGRQVFERRRRTAVRRDGTTYTLTSPLATQYVGAYRPNVHRPNIGNADTGPRRLRR